MIVTDPNVDKDSDLLVLVPGEFGEDNEALVVIVNSRCIRKVRLIHELRALTSSSPDSPKALVFVAEKRPGDVYLAQMLQRRFDDAFLRAEARSYYPR